MEPQLPKPQFNPEAAPSVRPIVQSGEVFTAPKTPEVTPPLERGTETREVMHDGPKGDPASTQPSTPPPLPAVGPVPPAATNQPQDDPLMPTVAADDDLIEKEWVEKAKQVVAETRNDPHAQDAAVGRLQADYLKKRYGKVIILPKEE